MQSLLEAADGRIWVGTRHGEIGIVDATSGQSRWLAQPSSSAPRGAVTSLVQPPGETVWVGRNSGIDWFHARDGRLLRQIRHDPCRSASLAANDVTGLWVDRAGWVWVSGIGIGLQRHNPANRSLDTRDIGAEPGQRCTDQDVRGLLQLDNGQLWVSTQQRGVIALDGSLEFIRRVALSQPAADTADAAVPVAAMAQSATGTVWLASAALLHELDREHRPVRSLRHGTGRTNQMLTDHDDSLWLATQDGLYRLRPGATQPQRLAPGADGGCGGRDLRAGHGPGRIVVGRWPERPVPRRPRHAGPAGGDGRGRPGAGQPGGHRAAVRPPRRAVARHRGGRAAPHDGIGRPVSPLRPHQRAAWHRQPAVRLKPARRRPWPHLDPHAFKAVNDSYGHASGDALLMQMRGRLHEVFRASDLLVRWGGEEFLIVALHTSRLHAADLAERVRLAVCSQAFALHGGQQVHKTCSIGFSCFPLVIDQPRALDWSTMVDLADEAWYLVKRSGRNRWLGVLSADAAPAQSLHDWARRPLTEWQASGALQMAGSPPRTPWAANPAEVQA